MNIFTMLLFLLVTNTLSAEIRLPWFFSDNMVLQQKSSPSVWGWTNKKTNVKITTSWNKKQYIARPDGEGKWKTNISTPKAGGPYQITVSDGEAITIKNILIGEVWICSGQSNMEMPLKGFKNQPIANSNEFIFESNNDNIRLYNIPRSVQPSPLDTNKRFEWKTANPADVRNFSAVGYLFGKMLYEKLGVPIGLINVSYGGSPVEAFMDEATLKKLGKKVLEIDEDTKLTNKMPTTLYNGMIHPLIGYKAKGFIWYQGESNAENAGEYETLFPASVEMLRTQFGYGDFPFYFVQIAPFDYNLYKRPGEEMVNSAFLREAQRKSLATIPNSAMVVTLDVGDSLNIHPMDKETVAKRLALLALNKTYGYNGFESESPLFESMDVTNDQVLVKFKNAANGLTTFGLPLYGFQIAGSDKIFYPAKASISNKGVELSAGKVPHPVAVRYAFTNCPSGTLFNTEGFPASSFRTDDWEDPKTFK